MPTATGFVPADGDGLSHLAFLYRGLGEYLEHLLAFIREGLACSEPVFVALPGNLAGRVRAAAGAADWQQLAVADMNELGRNPARITLALGTFAAQHAGHRIRIVTEPLWPGRTDAEAAEVMKHEALVQRAVAVASAEVLCPYDASRLSPARIGGACHTHPEILEGGHRRPSSGYAAGDALPEAELPPPPASAGFLAYRSRLHPGRALVSNYAERAGLPAERRADLTLAVSEITANTLAHTAGGGTVHIWISGHEVICQVHDGGWITDPMAGRKRPPPDASGQGLWVVNHVCDLVERRSGPAGTTTRMHFRLPGR
jgi:anti-sigma regulatory factor (Ser/Thr protein kinase)